MLRTALCALLGAADVVATIVREARAVLAALPGRLKTT